MKVLHYQHNGVGVVLAAEQRALGIEARVLATGVHPFGFKEDFLLPQRTGWRQRLEWLDWARYSGYDVFHNHDLTIPRRALDRWSGAIVQHYHAPSVVAPVDGASVVLASLPTVVRAMPTARWMPLPARTRLFRPDLRTHSDIVRVGHSAQTTDPTKLALQAGDAVDRAVARTGGLACSVPLTGVVDVDHMAGYYSGIDVWVDRVGCDFYGFSAIEAAAMGIPVITHIGSFESEFVPGCPFISVERDGVEDAVLEIVRDNDRRDELGRASREFVERVHAADLVAASCVDIYRALKRG